MEPIYWVGGYRVPIWRSLIFLITTILQVGTGMTFISQVRKQVQKGPVIEMPKVTKGINTSKRDRVLVKCQALCPVLYRNDVSQPSVRSPTVGPAGLPFLRVRTRRLRAARQWLGGEPWPPGPICFHRASREVHPDVPPSSLCPGACELSPWAPGAPVA